MLSKWRKISSEDLPKPQFPVWVRESWPENWSQSEDRRKQKETGLSADLSDEYPFRKLRPCYFPLGKEKPRSNKIQRQIRSERFGINRPHASGHRKQSKRMCTLFSRVLNFVLKHYSVSRRVVGPPNSTFDWGTSFLARCVCHLWCNWCHSIEWSNCDQKSTCRFSIFFELKHSRILKVSTITPHRFPAIFSRQDIFLIMACKTQNWVSH